MSNIHVSGARALPFTGLATLPILVLGALLTAAGFIITLCRPRSN
jgi:hypothetical protein